MKLVNIFLCFAIAAGTVFTSVAPAQTPATQPSAKELVAKLGAGNFKERDQAQKDLVKMGDAAVEEVTAGLKSTDDEVRSRCEAILKALQTGGNAGKTVNIDKQLLWTMPMEKPPAAGIAISKGLLFVVTPEGKLVAADPKTGKEKWSTKDTKDVFDWLAPLACGDLVYVCAKEGNIVAFDAATGKESWRTKLTVGLPALSDGVIYACSDQAGLVALDAKTGEQKWQAKDVKTVGTPVVAGNALYSIGADQKVRAYDLKQNGALLWTAKDYSSVLAALAVSGDVVLALDYKALHGLAAKDGSEKWSKSVVGEMQRFPNGALDIIPSDPTPQQATRNFYIGQAQRPLCIADGAVYMWIGSRLDVVNAMTGDELWKLETVPDPAKRRKAMKLDIGIMIVAGPGKPVPGAVDFSCSMGHVRPVAVADGIVYVGLSEGLLAVNTKTRLKEWSVVTKPPAGRPMVIDGVLYFGLTGVQVAMSAATMPADKLTVAGLHALKLK